jgi:hypothetical protein
MLPGPLVSGCRHAARSPLSLPHPFAAHWALLPPGPAGQSAAPASLAPCRPPLFAVHSLRLRGVRRPPLSERPRAITSVPCRFMSPNLVPPLSAPFAPPCSATAGTPTPPLPLLQKEPVAMPRSLLPPSLSSAHGHVSPPLIHAGDRAAAVLIIFLTAVVAVPPSPHGETRLSATIALFGAALTSLILPRISRS